MKARVRLTFSIEMSVEGKSEDAIMNWLSNHTPEEALELAQKTSTSTFDGTVEVSINLNVDPGSYVPETALFFQRFNNDALLFSLGICFHSSSENPVAL